MRRLISAAGGLTAALLISPVAPAAAQGEKPAPAGCFGGVMDDGTGDTSLNGAPFPGLPANLDVKKAWFRVLSPERAVVDIQVAELDKTVTSGWDAHGWWARYTIGDARMFVLAQVDSAGTWTFFTGSDGDDGYLIGAPTTGRTFEGPDGIIEIDLPDTAVGSKLSTPHVTARTHRTMDGQPIFSPSADRAPDGTGSGKDFDAQPCGPVAPSGPAQAAPAALDVKAGSAKRSGKAVTVNLTGQATKLKGNLVKGGKTVAKGSLAKLAGKGRIKLTGPKSIAKGSYTLRLTGTDAAGRPASRSLKLKLA